MIITERESHEDCVTGSSGISIARLRLRAELCRHPDQGGLHYLYPNLEFGSPPRRTLTELTAPRPNPPRRAAPVRKLVRVFTALRAVSPVVSAGHPVDSVKPPTVAAEGVPGDT